MKKIVFFGCQMEFYVPFLSEGVLVRPGGIPVIILGISA
jgi:hypothetical protein